MLYLYDRAIAQDLSKSFNPEGSANPIVKVYDPEGSIDLVAHMENDEVTYPLVSITRSDAINVDRERYNFTRAKRGVIAGFDNEKNNYYLEKALPITLEYDICIVTTNTADMDELVKELLFKYSDQYFLKITLPYEVKRDIRFAIEIDKNSTIERTSRSFDYISAGQLHQAIIKLNVIGAVLVSYTTQHMNRIDPSITSH